MPTKFGSLLKRLRVGSNQTLRVFCRSHGFDPGNFSRLERGLYPPPQNQDLLRSYATALGLEEGSDGWLELFDLAAAERGEFPRDLLDDEKLLDKLPMLFRTLRATPVDEDKLDNLVEEIRKG